MSSKCAKRHSIVRQGRETPRRTFPERGWPERLSGSWLRQRFRGRCQSGRRGLLISHWSRTWGRLHLGRIAGAPRSSGRIGSPKLLRQSLAPKRATGTGQSRPRCVQTSPPKKREQWKPYPEGGRLEPCSNRQEATPNLRACVDRARRDGFCPTGEEVPLPHFGLHARGNSLMRVNGLRIGDKQEPAFRIHLLFVSTKQHHGGESPLGVPPVGWRLAFVGSPEEKEK